MGILKYCGTTDFASGQWAGIALDEEDGKNDGSVGGVRYFHCEPRHGEFFLALNENTLNSANLSYTG